MKFFQKKNKAVKRWHSRAMLIDLRKTKVTFIHTGEPDDFDLEQLNFTETSQPKRE